MLKWILKYSIPLIIILCLVSRIPQIVSENLFLDGDECIVGLMAKHFIEGKGIPVFFYGQSYGFSFIEVLVISVSFLIFGISDIAVKVSMLLIWTTGIVFFYLTLKEIGFKNNNWAPLLITLLLIFLPSWAIWSMKARGGYLTAFTLLSLYTYLALNNKLNKSLIVMLSSGFLIVIIYYSQALWLAGLLPIVIYQLSKLKRTRLIISFLSGVAMGIVVFFLLKLSASNFWAPSVFKFSSFSIESFSFLPQLIFNHLTGHYSYTDISEPVFIIKLTAFTFTFLIFTTLSTAVFLLFRKSNINPWFYVFCFSVLLTIGYTLFIDRRSPRYLMPISVYSLFAIYFLADHLKKQIAVNAILIIMILLGSVSIYHFKNYKYESKAELLELINELKTRNIHYVYSEQGLLQWQIMFYSNENIIARYKSSIDRYPEYIEKVDDAFRNNNTTVALTGFIDPNETSYSEDRIIVNNSFFIILNPGKKNLSNRGFDIR